MTSNAGMLLTLALVIAAVGCGGEYSGGSSGDTSAPQQLQSGAASAGGADAFEATVYPILRLYCAECHEGAGPGSPHIASANTQTAYLEVVNQGKVNLAVPDSSRLVQKVEGGHHCWDPAVPVPGESDCDTDANEILAAIVEWAEIIDFDGEGGGVSLDETLASSSLTMGDGIEDVGVERYSGTLIALYEFKEGTGSVARDTSGVEPANDLELEGDYEWMSAWGVQFNDGRALGQASYKLYDEIADPAMGTGQYSVEAWITNANVTQDGPARIITYSRDTGSRNFTLGQVAYTYDFRNRALLEELSGNGTPALRTYDADEDAQDRLQHVVMTYDQFRGRRIYVDGVWTDDVDEVEPGRLWNWERGAAYRFALGDEVGGEDRHWQGQIRMVAVYDSALTQRQIEQNFQAGVGRRRLLRFDVSRWTTPRSAIEFEVSDFDNYSYLFCMPTYETDNPAELRVANIRIAVNGEIPTTGQGFRTLDAQVTSGHQELSRQCSVIPKGPDPGADSFTLVFEHLGAFQNLVVEPDPGDLIIVLDPEARPERGMRDFARVNETMSVITGIDAGTSGPRQAYQALEQQLPGEHDLRAFVSSHQVGIAKLALEYCDQMVENTTRRDVFFGAFPFGTAPEVVFGDAANRLQISDALYDGALGDGLSEQPLRQGVRDDLNILYDSLLLECTPTTPCNAERTKTMVKAACAAVLSSAAVSIH
jgi:hypothetical protein